MPGIIVLGAQWGDEGKGKATDQLGTSVDMVVKFNGGNNAGHTVVVDGQEYALHLLPAGILSEQAIPVIGNGVVVDLEALFDEIDQMSERGVDCSRLLVSANAHVIAPYNRRIDRANEKNLGSGQIGTTGRGIGPTYADKMNRVGLRVQDLLHPEVLQQRVEAVLRDKNALYATAYGEDSFDSQELVDLLLRYAKRLRPYVADTQRVINQALDNGQTVLFEGGQATMLDIDHGTYPYVTSSNATAGGALTGSGVGPTKIDRVVGVAKAYTTRVGEGPFPTELTGVAGERLRDLGGEYGVTTGRARRVGWGDAVVLRYAVQVNGLTDIVLTKLDVLGAYETILVCVGYRYQGQELQDLPQDQVVFANVEPIYQELPGWQCDISGVREFQDLPPAARDYVLFLEEQAGCRISLVGVGQGRDDTIVRHKLL